MTASLTPAGAGKLAADACLVADGLSEPQALRVTAEASAGGLALVDASGQPMPQVRQA